MNDWDKNLAAKAIRAERLNKQSIGNTRQDLSLPVLENLVDRGYTQVEWDSGNSRHSRCVDLNKQKWAIDQFISGLLHSAPIFEKSHPGDLNCTVLVTGENLPEVRVDSYGNVNENVAAPIRTRKVKAPPRIPVAPEKIKKVPLTPKPKVVRTPTKPEKNYLYVPKKQWEEIKEQPSQHEITDEEREEWLRDLERETSLNKARKILKGIVEKE